MSKAITNKLENGWQLSVNNSGNYFLTNSQRLEGISEERAKRLIKKGYTCIDLEATEYYTGEYMQKLHQSVDELFKNAPVVTVKEYQMY